MRLTSKERNRYARHLALPEIGEAGQLKLRSSSVLVVGTGGLGSPIALYLAAAGVGHLGIADNDSVDPSNLQRQLLHATADIGRKKVQSALEKLAALNPHIRLTGHEDGLTPANALALVGRYDFIVDATDNFPAKFRIASTCHTLRKPYSHAGIKAFLGQTLTVLPGATACCGCLFGVDNEEPGADIPRGPLGAVPGVIGSIQATEAVKYLLGIGALLTNALLVFEALAMTFRRVPVKRNPTCPICGDVKK